MSTQQQASQIFWNESYSVGVHALDVHHQHLAKLINQLDCRHSDDLNSEEVTSILTDLIAYTEYHFRHEEELMAAVDYAELENHRREHMHFSEVIAEICFGATLGVLTAKELFSYLTRWWRNHILLEDMKYKPYLLAVSAPNAPVPA